MSQDSYPDTPAPPAGPHAEPSPELVAFFTGKALFERLAAYARKRKVPTRCVEEVVQDALASGWKSRHSWPATAAELVPWMYFVANARVCDFFRERDDMEHAFGKKDTITGHAPGATPFEAHEALQWAQDHAADKPGMLRALGWVSRHLMGHSYAEIAAKDGVTEQTIKSAVSALRENMREAFGKDNVNAVLAAFFILLGLFLAWRSHQEAKNPPPAPKPVPTVVAPTPEPAPAPQTPPPLSADDLRTRAFGECDAKQWTDCMADLQRAKNLDPAGDKDPRVQKAWKAAFRGVDGKP